jgi:hypothetical protein
MIAQFNEDRGRVQPCKLHRTNGWITWSSIFIVWNWGRWILGFGHARQTLKRKSHIARKWIFILFSAWLLFVGRGPGHLQSRAKILWNLKSMEMGSILVVWHLPNDACHYASPQILFSNVHQLQLTCLPFDVFMVFFLVQRYLPLR